MDVAGLSRTRGTGPKTAHKRLRRFLADGRESLADQPHARGNRARPVPADSELRCHSHDQHLHRGPQRSF